ncbi:MAG: RNA polymerase subunit sigma-70 [Draconibacterium sp.]|nr:MAG: RNA polymerase subunit sigma-70 [Draconibacterium sp.]
MIGVSNLFMNLSDTELISLIKTGEDTKLIFNEIYNRYYNKVYFKSLQILKSVEDTKDVVHDIFVKVFRNLESLKNDAHFSSWVYAITYNTCLSFLKENKRFSDDLAEVDILEDISVSTLNEDLTAIKIEQLNSIMMMIMKLKDEERLILLMHYYDEFSIKEITTYTGLSESAVKMRLKRSRDKLKQLISKT